MEQLSVIIILLLILSILSIILSYRHINNKLRREHNERLDLAIEAANLLTWRYDVKQKKFHILQGTKLLGYKKTIHTTEEHSHLIHPDDRDKFYPLLNDLIEGKINKGKTELRITTEYGWMWIRCIFIPIYNINRIVGVTGATIDITLEKEAVTRAEKEINIIKDEKDLMNNILNNISIPVHIKNPETHEITFANAASKNILGAKTGVKVETIMSKESFDKIKEIDKNIIETGKSYSAKETLTLADGKKIDTYVHKNIINYGGIKQILISRTDETEINKALRASQVLSVSLPTIKAFSWFFDSREDFLYIYHNMTLDRFKSNIVSDDDFIKAIHKDDVSSYLNEVFDLKSRDTGYSTLQFRGDIEKIGNYEWWESHGTTEVRYENGVSYKIVCGLTININERKEAELQMLKLKQKTELILQNTNSDLIYIDTNFNILWSNMELITKHNRKENLIHEVNNYNLYQFEEIYADCILKDVINNKKTIKSNRIYFENRLYDITYVPIVQENTTIRILIKLDDRTDHYLVIDEMIKAKEKAEKSDKLKSAFLANMSHEIRTPLNAIVGFSDLITLSDNEKEREEYYKLINSNSELLLRIINDILDLSKIETGLFEYKNKFFEINPVIDDLYSNFSLRVSKDVSLICHKPEEKLFACLDKNRFIQIFNNFLSNAVKYTAKGEINFGYTVENDRFKLYVRDTGIGISEENKKMVFQRFCKFNDFAQGTGLGLSICKAMADCDEKSDIGFESELGKGSEFWFEAECKMRKELN